MAVNLIVLAVTALMAGFVLVWLCCPRLRPWIEAPKYRVLTWEERFGNRASDTETTDRGPISR